MAERLWIIYAGITEAKLQNTKACWRERESHLEKKKFSPSKYVDRKLEYVKNGVWTILQTEKQPEKSSTIWRNFSDNLTARFSGVTFQSGQRAELQPRQGSDEDSSTWSCSAQNKEWIINQLCHRCIILSLCHCYNMQWLTGATQREHKLLP